MQKGMFPAFTYVYQYMFIMYTKARKILWYHRSEMDLPRVRPTAQDPQLKLLGKVPPLINNWFFL